jgi:myo-inositol-1(or 4)-monophosphatase
VEARVAVEAALAAGHVIRRSFSGPLGGAHSAPEARRNGPHDVVTPIDATSERLIADTIARAFPADGFMGEETEPREPAPGAPAARIWIVDPIDGTVGFASGIPFFAVSIALSVGSDIVLGVVHDPIHRETFLATRGGGAWLLGPEAKPEAARRRMLVRQVASLTDAVVAADPGDPGDDLARHRMESLRERVRVVRTLGSTALSLAYLAAGRLDGVLQVRGLQAVDIAGGGLLVIEAGGSVTDAAGGPWLDLSDPGHGRGIAAGSRRVLRSLLGD